MSKVTHVFAICIAAVSAFLASPAGIALMQQYPHIAPIVMGIVAVFGVYHNPAVAAPAGGAK